MRQRKMRIAFPNRVIWALRYLPNNRICEVEGRKCYDVHANRADAERSRNIFDGIENYVLANYRVARLPACIPPGYKPKPRKDRNTHHRKWW